MTPKWIHVKSILIFQSVAKHLLMKTLTIPMKVNKEKYFSFTSHKDFIYVPNLNETSTYMCGLDTGMIFCRTLDFNVFRVGLAF